MPASPAEERARFIDFSLLRQGVIAGAEQWLFAIDDGDADSVAVSYESAGELWAGRVYLNRPHPPGSWVVAGAVQLTNFGRGDTYNSVSDHWHIFAFGVHIFAYSNQRADRVRMIVTDTTFTILQQTEVTNDRRVPAYRVDVPLAPLPLVQGAVTNDLHCVADTPRSVLGEQLVAIAIGAYVPGAVPASPNGHHVFFVDITADPARNPARLDHESTFVDRSTTTRIIYEASARRVPRRWPGSSTGPSGGGSEFQVVVPSTLTMAANVLYLVASADLDRQFDVLATIQRRSYSPLAPGLVDHQLAMGTAVGFANGFQLVTCRDIVDPQPGASGDHGSVVAWLLDDTHRIVPPYSASHPAVRAEGNRFNRPHTSRHGDVVLTCFDTEQHDCVMQAHLASYDVVP